LCRYPTNLRLGHTNPEGAFSDGYQSLTFKQFEQTMARVCKVADALGVRIASQSRRVAV